MLIASVTLNVGLAAIPVTIVARKGGVDYLIEKVGLRTPAYTPETWQDDWARWLRTLPRADSDVLFVGDSIVAAGKFSEHFSTVKNRGIGAEMTAGVLHRFDEIFRGDARQVFLHVGTNDLAAEWSVADIVEKYTELLDRVTGRCPGADVHVISVLPINCDIDDNYLTREKSRRIPQLNARLAGLCAQRGVQFIDLYPLFADERGMLRRDYTHDGLHLTLAGYDAYYRAIKPFVRCEQVAAEPAQR